MMRASRALSSRGAFSHLTPKRVFQEQVACMSGFANVPMGPPDPIFGLTDAFKKVSESTRLQAWLMSKR